MQRFFRVFILLFFSFTVMSSAKQKEPIDLSMVISGGVSLGAYEAGYNWAMIKMLSDIKNHSQVVDPHLRSVTGASAGSINALLSAMYWCQKEENQELNNIDDNLFFTTWVELGLSELIIKGRDSKNKSTLFTRKSLHKSANKILNHLQKPIYQQGCEVPLGFSVTKVKPIVTEFQNSGIKIKNQHFSIPLTLKETAGSLQLFNKESEILKKSTDFHISIPNMDTNNSKIIDVLFASSAFPAAFEQIKLNYVYNGVAQSSYFIDGGAYDNLPLQLATELDERAKDFIFIDPSNMRKEKVVEEKEEEVAPHGFLSSNVMPLMNAVNIFQNMRLYNAINQYFGENSGKKLILSSRKHPITGKFLGHFGAFLNRDFRVYDYHVGVYDAVYHLSKSMRERNYSANLSQTELMEQLKKRLGIEENIEAKSAYELFFKAEFKQATNPKVVDNISAIYTAFNKEKVDEKRYSFEEFNIFLSKLNMEHIKDKNSFIPTKKEKMSEWYKRPLNLVIDRISALENDYADAHENGQSFAKMTNMLAWVSRSMIKEKEGFHRAVNIPEDQENETLVAVLKALPTEISTDLKNGGVGLSYNAYWYNENDFFDAYEAKMSFNQSDDISSFIRLDLNTYHEFNSLYKVGMGASLFGNLEKSFYNSKDFHGVNTYVDVLDIFRITYVRRIKHPKEKDYIYFGLRNLTSLFYWLQR